MNKEENIIEIKDLCKEYKMYHRKKDRLLEILLPKYENHTTFKAMDGFNLEVKKGEIVGILGRNGAGKSTLLKMITGVVVPTSGEIKANPPWLPVIVGNFQALPSPIAEPAMAKI